jgi:hypothetical protein
MNRMELFARALAAYPFRDPEPDEDAGAYIRAVLAHVRDRDLSMAEEIRLGKVQAEWTPEEARHFQEHCTDGWTGPREEFDDYVFVGTRDPGPYQPTAAVLLELASAQLEDYMAMRCQGDVPFISLLALLDTGELLLSGVDRDHRLAALKYIARTERLFGFSLVAEYFIHGVNPEGKAEKRDAVVANIGTRDLRIFRMRPFHYVAGAVVFDEAPPDVDMRGEAAAVDAYASVFVSVPPPSGPPS